MYRILLPVDEGRASADAQIEALRSLPGDPDELSVTVLYVYEEIDTPADEAGQAFIDDLNRSLDEIRDVPESVEAVEAALEADDVEYARQERVGDAESAILSAARDVDADAILIGVRKRSPVGKVLFGSVSQGVLLNADRPVVVAPV